MRYERAHLVSRFGWAVFYRRIPGLPWSGHLLRRQIAMIRKLSRSLPLLALVVGAGGAGGFVLPPDAQVADDRGEDIRLLVFDEIGRRTVQEPAAFFVTDRRIVPSELIDQAY